jgi:hypothetical protein
VAVTTINAVVTNVMLVTELNGLLSLYPLSGIPRRTIEFNRRIKSGGHNKYGTIDRDFGECVGAVVEYLHRWRIYQGALNYRAIKLHTRGEQSTANRGKLITEP